MRRKPASDLASVSETELRFWLAALLYVLLTRLDRLENEMATVSELVADLAAEDAELRADADQIVVLLSTQSSTIDELRQQVTDLQTALNAGGITPEQVAQLQSSVDSLGATHNELSGVLPTP